MHLEKDIVSLSLCMICMRSYSYNTLYVCLLSLISHLTQLHVKHDSFSFIRTTNSLE